MERYIIERIYLPTETLGSWYHKATRTFICKTMELPWRNNHSSSDSSKASCVPEGVYLLRKQAPKEGRPYGYFRFVSVPGRRVNPLTSMSHILVHRITYVNDLLGCIGVGGRFVDLNNDGVPDMVESGKTLQWMYENLPDEFELEIIEKP